MSDLDGQGREAPMHRARAEHYAALSRAGDPERRINAVEEDFNAGYRAALAAREEPRGRAHSTTRAVRSLHRDELTVEAAEVLAYNMEEPEGSCEHCGHFWNLHSSRREWWVERGLKGHDVNVIHGEPLEIGQGIRLVPVAAREDTERPDGQSTAAVAVKAEDEIGLVRVRLSLDAPSYLLPVSQARNLGELLIEAADKLTHRDTE